MQITISVSHTFEDVTHFAAFAPELKAFLDRFFSGSPSPRLPEARGMTPRDRANDIAPPAVPLPPSETAQPAPIEPATAVAASTPVAEEAPAVSPSLLQPEPSPSEEPAPTKRTRRTKAEMAAARASGAVAPLPSAGTFSGPTVTSAPTPAVVEPDPFDPFNPDSVPAPTPKPAASGITYADVKAAFAPLLMHEDSEPHVLEVIGRFGLTKLNECMDKPELHAPVRDALLQLQKTLGVAA